MIFRYRSNRLANDAGFTLVELTVVGALVGLISMTCWPMVKELSKGFIERSEASATLTKMQAARERAVATGITQSYLATTFHPDGTVEQR